MIQLNAQQLRSREPTEAELKQIRLRRRELFFLLDNVYDTYNVGGIFRLADAVGVKKVFLCGSTECPPNSRIHKAAVGTDQWVDWEYCSSARQQIAKFKIQNSKFKVVGIEQRRGSVPLSQAKFELPLVLALGNETDGISPDVLDLCDQIVEIPMPGVNKSLNVIVSAAMVMGKLTIT